ncbi:MAG: 50S ribosome-binding GTPase [Candidatus Omnitrophica bacterium]|nr:50S ribosome-binding GTPase [Candidatus Omnitrophota bacterium]
MDRTIDSILERLDALDTELFSWDGRLGDPELSASLKRWTSDLGALRHHLVGGVNRKPILVLIGGTGTGKSTLTNRLLDREVSATSFRRTFTSGPIAFVAQTEDLPEDWLGLPHRRIDSKDLPAKGSPGYLSVVEMAIEPLARFSLVDTPDVDGDAETHYEQAEQAFRWADAVVFLVTPEKYQMTELLPFYRLARRYEIPSQFMMNKCESEEVVEDYRKQIEKRGFSEPIVYSIPRDDSTHLPPEDEGLDGLRDSLMGIQPSWDEQITLGQRNRTQDLALRLGDQVLLPLRNDLASVEKLTESLHQFVSPGPQVDVSPMTAELQERMQAKSILYLMGPKRILERAKKFTTSAYQKVTSPTSWFGKKSGKRSQEGETIEVRALPDFHSMLVDQFRIAQAQIRDILEGNSRSKVWISQAGEKEPDLWIDPEGAGEIVDQELEDLNRWLKDHWESTPRDTKTILSLLNYIPGGKRVVEWSEASPYLLVIVAAAYNSFFGPIDLLVIGGYSVATWLGEKLSNEVTGRVRKTNQIIYRRFEELMREQVEHQIEWLEKQTPSKSSIERAEDEIDRIAALLESEGGAG